MRIAHLTDLHLTEGPRLSEQAQVLDGIVRRCEELGVQLTLLTGDLYGRTVPHRSTPAERAVLYPLVARLSRLGPVVVTPGNHDYPGDLDSLEAIGGGLDWPVVVATRPLVQAFHVGDRDVHVYAMPWPTTKVLVQNATELRGAADQREAAGRCLDQLLDIWSMRIRAARQRDPDSVHLFAGHLMVGGSTTAGGEVLSGRDIEVSRHKLGALGVDYGALGHMHQRQEVAPRIWYGGDPYCVDFGEADSWPQTWNLVDNGWSALDQISCLGTGRLARFVNGQPFVSVHALPTNSPPWVTLDWEWGGLSDAAWIKCPRLPSSEYWRSQGLLTAAHLGPDIYDSGRLVDVRGTHVRARLTVPQHLRASCPWDDVLQSIRDAGALSVRSEVNTIPTHRVRAPEVVEATTPEDQLRAYWSTLDAPPDPAAEAAAVEVLHELLTEDDEAIRARTNA